MSGTWLAAEQFEQLQDLLVEIRNALDVIAAASLMENRRMRGMPTPDEFRRLEDARKKWEEG